MDRRPIKVAAVAPANKIARVAWNEEIGQELHTVPFIRTVAQLEASILDLNLMLRHRAAGNGTALRKPASREDVMNESKHTGFDTADITALSHLYRGEVYRSTVWRTRLDASDQLGCRDYRIGALADVQHICRLGGPPKPPYAVGESC